MAKVIPFPLHRSRRVACDTCGHPSSVDVTRAPSACRFCNAAQVAQRCRCCGAANIDCPSCSRVLAGVDEIF